MEATPADEPSLAGTGELLQRFPYTDAHSRSQGSVRSGTAGSPARQMAASGRSGLRKRQEMAATAWREVVNIDELNDFTMQDWSPRQRYIYACLNNRYFEVVIGIVIVLNLVLVAVETDASVDGDHPAMIFEIMNWIVVFVFVVEIALKAYVYRSFFFVDEANVIDFFIVAFDVVLCFLSVWFQHMPSFAILRVFRCVVRLSRALRFATFFEELYTMLQGFRMALNAIFWGVFLLVLSLVVWSILAVQLVHPLTVNMELEDCDRCAVAFDSVWRASLTLFGFAMFGDGWSTLTVPIVWESPGLALFFLGVLISITFSTMNLLLAVIVEHAEEARQHTLHLDALDAEHKIREAKQRLLTLCADADTDNNGCLSSNELKKVFNVKQEFSNALRGMGAHREDVEMVFRILEEDGRDEMVRYEDLADQIHRMIAQGVGSLQSQLTLTQVTKIHQEVRDCLRMLKDLRSADGGESNAKDERLPTRGPGGEAHVAASSLPRFGGRTGEQLAQFTSDLARSMKETLRRMEVHIQAMEEASSRSLGSAAPAAEGAGEAGAGRGDSGGLEPLEIPGVGGGVRLAIPSSAVQHRAAGVPASGGVGAVSGVANGCDWLRDAAAEAEPEGRWPADAGDPASGTECLSCGPRLL